MFYWIMGINQKITLILKNKSEENKMPYVPSEKTDGVSQDRKILDPIAKQLAEAIALVAAKYDYKGHFWEN